VNLQQIVTELKADRDRIDRAIILRTGSDSWACFAFAHRARWAAAIRARQAALSEPRQTLPASSLTLLRVGRSLRMRAPTRSTLRGFAEGGCGHNGNGRSDLCRVTPRRPQSSRLMRNQSLTAVRAELRIRQISWLEP